MIEIKDSGFFTKNWSEIAKNPAEFAFTNDGVQSECLGAMDGLKWLSTTNKNNIFKQILTVEQALKQKALNEQALAKALKEALELKELEVKEQQLREQQLKAEILVLAEQQQKALEQKAFEADFADEKTAIKRLCEIALKIQNPEQNPEQNAEQNAENFSKAVIEKYGFENLKIDDLKIDDLKSVYNGINAISLKNPNIDADALAEKCMEEPTFWMRFKDLFAQIVKLFKEEYKSELDEHKDEHKVKSFAEKEVKKAKEVNPIMINK